MKIIFLDIDGVLNCTQWFRSSRQTTIDNPAKTNLDFDKQQMDPKLIKNLNKITNDTGAKIVLSSTWRIGRTIEQIQELFDYVGITGELIGKTPEFYHKDCQIPRGEEIRTWLKTEGYKHNYRDYVIIDDDSDFLYNQRDHLFLTDNEFGLGTNYAYRIINFLNHKEHS